MEKENLQNQPAQEEQKIRLYGFEQVVQVLLTFDMRYREQMLTRIAARDRQLAQDLRNAVLSKSRGRS